MRKARNNNNFIDKTFTIIADVILRVFPASQQEKKAFSYYLNGVARSDKDLETFANKTNGDVCQEVAQILDAAME